MSYLLWEEPFLFCEASSFLCPQSRSATELCPSQALDCGLCMGIVKGMTMRLVGRNQHDSKINCIYAFVTKSEPQYVKFGVSVNPDKRLRSIAGCCPHRITCVGYVQGTYAEEARLLDALHEHHLHGEWFLHEGAAKAAADMIHDGDIKALNHIVSELLKKKKCANEKTYYQKMEEKIVTIRANHGRDRTRNLPQCNQ